MPVIPVRALFSGHVSIPHVVLQDAGAIGLTNGNAWQYTLKCTQWKSPGFTRGSLIIALPGPGLVNAQLAIWNKYH